MREVRIGDSRNDVSIIVSGRERPASTDFHDGNWLSATVSVSAGAWRGEYRANLRTEDFRSFLDEVRSLRDMPEGKAEFNPMEPWIVLQLEGDGRGRVAVTGQADDRVATGNKLSFHFDVDQTFLPSLIRDLESLLAEFPVIGEAP
jgi:hypothetical protein